MKKVSDIIGEISTASDEQASGIGQINQAVTSMDKMTQQNAALVEEAATAADSLSSQAKSVLETFAFFKVATDASPRRVFEPAFEVEKAQQPSRKKPAADTEASAPAPSRKPAAAPPSQPRGDDPNVWEQF
ncbi:MAG: hypothetical protein JNM69_33305 [Archangium sp.]|nr:hypothetical protein [Archangium sp.]